MNRRLSIYQICALTVAVASVLVAIVRIIILKNNIEINNLESGNIYFITRNIETIGFVIFSICFTAAFVVIGLFIGKRANGFIPLESSPVIFASALCGFMLLATGLYYSYLFFTTENVETVKFIISLLMIAASVMFLNQAISKENNNNKKLEYFRVIVCVYAFVRLVMEFVSVNSKPINSAIVYHILSMIMFMMFMIYEGKLNYSSSSIKFYLITGYLCIFFMVIYALPNMMVTLTSYNLDSYILFSAVDLVFGFYAFSRTFSVTSLKNQQ